jgi:[ribosomal protein S5]-alanine N-acetyltransferase
MPSPEQPLTEDDVALPRPVLRGEHVTLRGPIPRDREDRRAAGTHPEYARMLGEWTARTRLISEEQVHRWYQQLQDDPLRWVIEVERRCVGVARLHHLDEVNRRARYAIAIFDPTLWGQGIGTEATRLVLGHTFDTMHLHRVDLRVLAGNSRAIAVYEKCGFVREGLERDSVRVDGEWQSDVIMSILEDDYRQRVQHG